MKTKKAVVGTAKKNKLQQISYCISSNRSSGKLKEMLGILLLRLQNPLEHKQRKIGWKLFEALLLQYLAIESGEDSQ